MLAGRSPQVGRQIVDNPSGEGGQGERSTQVRPLESPGGRADGSANRRGSNWQFS
jgi:hypothetical protein